MKSIIALLVILNCTGFTQSITKNPEDGNNAQIKFLEMSPAIDGRLDSGLRVLEKRNFNFIDSNDASGAAVNISYRLAYGTEFFYIYIEVDSDTVIYRDRGYQNGDGLHLVFADPRADGKSSDEFYVLGFTPQKSGRKSWQRKFIWYRNKDLSFKRLKETAFEVKTTGSATGYEILIPWREIFPYHPWFSSQIGFNMCFVKASGESGKTYYYLLYDGKIQSEQSPRKYRIIDFAEPAISKDSQYYIILDRNNVLNGEKIKIKISGAASYKSKVKIYYKLLSGENSIFKRSSHIIDFGGELKRKEISVDLSGLVPGGYRLQILNGKGIETFELPFTILPHFNSEEAGGRLANVRENISEGSYSTLLFKLREIKRAFGKLKKYETAAVLRAKLFKFNELLALAEKGVDNIQTRTGIFRRAYLSEIDSSLQPYSIKIPRDYRPDKKYPLLLFLHGSGQDDRNILRESGGTILNEFIELAPKGRGTSNVYSADHAQDDIRESINDVINNYSIDTSKIILSGFSMGGYGVYRTFYETPERFAALSVFSGHPDLANKWGVGTDQPNFLKKEYLTNFTNKKIFIFHGEEDRNCPIALTKKLVNLLREADAEVTVVYEKDKGHERAGKATYNKYYKWLENVIHR